MSSILDLTIDEYRRYLSLLHADHELTERESEEFEALCRKAGD